MSWKGVTQWQNSHRAWPGWAARPANCPDHLFKMLQLPPRLTTSHRAKGAERGGSERCHRQGLEVQNPAPSSPRHNSLQTPALPQGWTAAPSLPAAPQPPCSTPASHPLPPQHPGLPQPCSQAAMLKGQNRELEEPWPKLPSGVGGVCVCMCDLANPAPAHTSTGTKGLAEER